jgi:hypothetical protein
MAVGPSVPVHVYILYSTRRFTLTRYILDQAETCFQMTPRWRIKKSQGVAPQRRRTARRLVFYVINGTPRGRMLHDLTTLPAYCSPSISQSNGGSLSISMALGSSFTVGEKSKQKARNWQSKQVVKQVQTCLKQDRNKKSGTISGKCLQSTIWPEGNAAPSTGCTHRHLRPQTPDNGMQTHGPPSRAQPPIHGLPAERGEQERLPQGGPSFGPLVGQNQTKTKTKTKTKPQWTPGEGGGSCIHQAGRKVSHDSRP